MSDLATYLEGRIPDGMSYPDAVQLCLRLYCTVDGVPKDLLPLNKEIIADAFAKLAGNGWVRPDKLWQSSIYGASLHQITDRGHWVEVIASIFKKGPELLDLVRGEALAGKAGFLTQERAT